MAKKQTKTNLKWYNYVLMSIFSLLTLFAGIPKFIPNPQSAQMLPLLNISQGFMYFLGLCWIAAAIGIWLPKTRIWAVLLTFPIICGAIMAVIVVGMPQAIGFLGVYVIVNILLLIQEQFFQKLA